MYMGGFWGIWGRILRCRGGLLRYSLLIRYRFKENRCKSEIPIYKVTLVMRSSDPSRRYWHEKWCMKRKILRWNWQLVDIDENKQNWGKLKTCKILVQTHYLCKIIPLCDKHKTVLCTFNRMVLCTKHVIFYQNPCFGKFSIQTFSVFVQ